MVDCRKLNARTLCDNFPFPTIEDCLNELGKAQVFSTIDLRSGYYQIEVAKADRYKTSFVLPFGQYEFVRIPFGFSTAPRTLCAQ